jgi:O-antigen/teichoic acid export membrane protein
MTEGPMAKPTLQLMSGRMLAFAGTFFIPVVLVRVFDPVAFGTYKQLLLIYATVSAVAQCGMAESLFYFIPRSPEKAARYAANAVLFLGVAGLVLFASLVWAAPRIASGLGNPGLAPHIALLGIFLWLSLTAAPLEIVLISRRRYLGAACAYGISDVTRAAMFILPALLTRRLEWVLVGAVAFALVRLVATLGSLQAQFGAALRPDLTALRAQLSYALPFQAFVIVDTVQANLHFYAVSRRFDAATFAVYSVGCLQLPIVEFLASPAAQVMMVRMSGAVREGRPDALVGLWHDTTRTLALVLFPLVALLVVTARDLILFLFTPAYAGSVPIFMVWTMTVLFAALQTDGGLRVHADTRGLLLIGLVRLAVVAGLIGAFFSSFGMLGAVLITVIALALGKALAVLRLTRLMGTTLSRVLPWRRLAAIAGVAVVSAVPALVVRSRLPPASLALLAATGLTYAATYLLLSHLLPSPERGAVAGWLARRTEAEA